MAGVERFVGVGAHELDVDVHAVAEIGRGVAVESLLEHVGHHLVEPRVGEPEVHEPGPGDLDGGDVSGRVGGEMVDQRLAELARVLADLLGGRESDIGGPVSVIAVGGALERDLVGQRVDPGFGERSPKTVAEVISDVHEGSMLPADPG